VSLAWLPWLRPYLRTMAEKVQGRFGRARAD
jgi:hypothetical protein